jgi:hypothetical protein
MAERTTRCPKPGTLRDIPTGDADTSPGETAPFYQLGGSRYSPRTPSTLCHELDPHLAELNPPDVPLLLALALPSPERSPHSGSHR